MTAALQSAFGPVIIGISVLLLGVASYFLGKITGAGIARKVTKAQQQASDEIARVREDVARKDDAAVQRDFGRAFKPGQGSDRRPSK